MKRIIIFEGPDGCGKTMLAKAVAKRLDAVYHHHGPYPTIRHGSDLVSIYASSMAPALRDYNHVVLDRNWVSEMPYGLAYRSGTGRLDEFQRNYLDEERMSCDCATYLCLPLYKVALENFQTSRSAQYLDTIDQFKQVYEWYKEWGIDNNWRPNFYIINPFDGRDHLRKIVDG